MNGDSDHDARLRRAILFADVAGYTRLMAGDEEGTHRTIGAHVAEFARVAGDYDGEILEVRGDGIFALFRGVANAARFATDIQARIAECNVARADEQKIHFRIGINLGEVLSDGNQVYGDAVNIAARLEAFAEPGEICVSRAVYEEIKNQLNFGYQHLGLQRLKNISVPVDVFAVREEVEGVAMTASHRSLSEPNVEEFQQHPSVVVLPLRNLGGNPDEDYFADGISEDLITSLSKFKNLFVIARASAFAYKGKRVRAQDVGRELGVRYVAEGSVRRAGNRIRVSAQLVDTQSGRALWAERYDRNLDDIFAVQDEITEVMVGATAAQIEAAELDRAGQTAPSDLQAYGLLLRGQQRISLYTRADNLEAQRFYTSALDHDDHYARALAALSRTLNIDWRYAWSDSPQATIDRALDLAQQAVLLDPDDARGHGELGFVHLYRKEHDAAIAAYQRALALNPNDADLMSDMADALAHSGRSQESVKLLGRAMMLNPFYPDQYLWHLGGAYFNLHDYESAIATLSRMNNPAEGHRLFAASYAHLNRRKEARYHASKVIETHPRFSLSEWAAAQPDRHRADLEHFIEGLQKAGL